MATHYFACSQQITLVDFSFYSITLHIDCSWLLVPKDWGNVYLREWNMKCFVHLGVLYYYALFEQKKRLTWVHLSIYYLCNYKINLVEFCTQNLLWKFSVHPRLTLSEMFYLMMLLVTEIIQHWWWMNEWMNVECWWNDTVRGKLIYLKKNVSRATGDCSITEASMEFCQTPYSICN